MSEVLSDFRYPVDEILVVNLDGFQVELEMGGKTAGRFKFANRADDVGVKNREVRMVARRNRHHDRGIEATTAERTNGGVRDQLRLHAGIQAFVNQINQSL